MSLSPILSVHNLHFSYSKQDILRDISFKVTAGEFIGIIGPNGTGKSTLIRLIAGLLKPESGKIHLSGKDIGFLNRTEISKQLAYVPQSIELQFPFKVREVVRMGRFPHHSGLLDQGPQSEAIVDMALDAMDLQSLKSDSFTELSGGEKQRVIIASALAQESRLLLLDEPTSALDLRHQQLILTQLKQLVQTQQKTTLFVTHDINLAAQFCDRLILIDHGTIVADGSPKEVLRFQLIQQVYGVQVYIDINPFTNTIYILPYSTL